MTMAMRVPLAVVASLFLCDVCVAAPFKLPPQLALTAYDTGTSGFNIAVAIGQQLKMHGTDVRVLPAGNGISLAEA